MMGKQDIQIQMVIYFAVPEPLYFNTLPFQSVTA